jgi:diacylglycerol kinase family enzyme
VDELLAAARARGLAVHVLGPDDNVAALASTVEATALGVAGGDGSLGVVAAVALDRDLPFVCVPFGTRNHFARDAGLDPDDAIAALDAFRGSERRIDVGRIADRLFLNNVSLGAYAHLVHRREHARRGREALARLRALAVALRRPRPLEVSFGAERHRVAVLLVSNNAYSLAFVSLGERERLDEGAVHLYFTERLFPWQWEERAGQRFDLDAMPARVKAAIDGEPAELEFPVEIRIEPLALRLLQPQL